MIPNDIKPAAPSWERPFWDLRMVPARTVAFKALRPALVKSGGVFEKRYVFLIYQRMGLRLDPLDAALCRVRSSGIQFTEALLNVVPLVPAGRRRLDGRSAT